MDISESDLGWGRVYICACVCKRQGVCGGEGKPKVTGTNGPVQTEKSGTQDMRRN